jgi:hypothetical protein
VTVANTATVASPTRKKQIKKQLTVATTKLFPVTSSYPVRSTEPPLPKPRGGTLRSNRSSYLWQFPELSGHSLMGEDLDEVQGAVLDLQKENIREKLKETAV